MTDYVKQYGNFVSFPANGQSWIILSDIERRIKEKIENIGKPLKDWDINIYRGILTGCNKAFIIDKQKRDELINKDKKSAEIIRPILRGRDIARYQANFADLYLINTHNGILSKNIPPIDIKKYPAIKAHLDKYWTEIKKREDQGITPYNLRSCAYMDDFSKQKIIFQEMVQESSFMYDKKGMFYCLDTCRIITGNNIDYLIGILNSKLFFFAVKYFYGGGGLGVDGVRMKHTFFENFSCPICNLNQKQIFLNLINKRLNSKDDEFSKIVESEIDQEVYSLYGLSKEEAKFIESL